MDDAAIAEAKQTLQQVALELAHAAEAAQKAVDAQPSQSWGHLQALLTRAWMRPRLGCVSSAASSTPRSPSK